MKKFLIALSVCISSLSADVYDYMPTIENVEDLGRLYEKKMEIYYKECRKCRKEGDVEGYFYNMGRAEAYSDAHFWTMMVGKPIPH